MNHHTKWFLVDHKLCLLVVLVDHEPCMMEKLIYTARTHLGFLHYEFHPQTFFASSLYLQNIN